MVSVVVLHLLHIVETGNGLCSDAALRNQSEQRRLKNIFLILGLEILVYEYKFE